MKQSAYPWRLSARIGTEEETYHYRTATEAYRWAMQLIRKQYSDVEVYRFEKGQYVKRDIPHVLIERAERERY